MTKRASFGPVVLLGLASAALAAVAGNKPWTDVEEPGGDCGSQFANVPESLFDALAKGAPLAGALGLVVLAAWGVLLVTRGWTRRIMAGLATVASLGYLVVAIEAYWSLKEATLEAAEKQFGDAGPSCEAASVWMNNTWWPAALTAGVLLVLAGLLAVWLAPAWPEMGTRYDAPGSGPAAPADPANQSNIDLWKQLDEGHDPTLGPTHDPGPGDDGPRA